MLLLDFATLDKRYSLTLVAAESKSSEELPNIEATEGVQPEHSIIQRRAMGFVDRTRKYPKRLQWAAFDKNKFEGFLGKLRALNHDMMGFLDAYQRNRHFQMQETTFMQILQIHNQLGDLFNLIQSLNSASKEVDENKSTLQNNRLIRLARFKGVNIAAETQYDGSSKGNSGLHIDVTRLDQLFSNADSHGETRPCATLDGGRPVWIEWRFYNAEGSSESDSSDANDQSAPLSFVSQRISRLAKLLSTPGKPAEFLVPKSVGYVHDENYSRFGFLFNNPERGNLLPKTLFSFISTNHKLSLTTRVCVMRMIATSIWYLHATN